MMDWITPMLILLVCVALVYFAGTAPWNIYPEDKDDPCACREVRVAKLVEALEYIAKYDADPLFVEAARAALDEWRRS
jgi:hypothetical protein